MGIAAAACLVFGWLLTGRYPWPVLPLVAFEWFLINLLNRVTDIDEDLDNGIHGTTTVARHAVLLTVASFGLMAGSFALSHWLWPALTPWRLVVHAIGLGYSYPIVPKPARRGLFVLARLKDLYFFKNFGSSTIFVLTSFAYPLALHPDDRAMSIAAIALLILFFVPFEMTYEVIYDLRDIDGDRALRIPTFPVMHGARGARRIVDAMLLASSAALGVGVGIGALGLREALLLVAPLIQTMWLRARPRHQPSPRDCIVLTHLGTGLLLFFVVGTAVWLALGLPANIHFGSG